MKDTIKYVGLDVSKEKIAVAVAEEEAHGTARGKRTDCSRWKNHQTYIQGRPPC